MSYIWIRSFDRIMVDSDSGWIEEDTYIDHGGKRLIKIGSDKEFIDIDLSEDVESLTKLNEIEGVKLYFHRFKNTDTNEVFDVETERIEYNSLALKDAGKPEYFG